MSAKDNFRVHKRAPAKHVEHLELWSRDAGKYYCNEMYYRTLEYIRTEAVSASTGALLPAVFIHVQNATQCKPEDDAMCPPRGLTRPTRGERVRQQGRGAGGGAGEQR